MSCKPRKASASGKVEEEGEHNKENHFATMRMKEAKLKKNGLWVYVGTKRDAKSGNMFCRSPACMLAGSVCVCLVRMRTEYKPPSSLPHTLSPSPSGKCT